MKNPVNVVNTERNIQPTRLSFTQNNGCSMAIMVDTTDNDALVLRAIPKAFNEAYAEAQIQRASPSDSPKFFDPAAVRVLYTAIQRALTLLEPSSDERLSDVMKILAIGVLRAAASGDRDVARLARAACWYYLAKTSSDAAPPSTVTWQ